MHLVVYAACSFLFMLLPIDSIALVGSSVEQVVQAEEESSVELEQGPRWLRSSRDYLSRRTFSLVEGVDRWFGDRPFVESGGRVSGSIYLSGLRREDTGFSPTTRFRLDVKMPNVDERLVLFLGRDDPNDVVTRQEDRLTEEQRSVTPAAPTDPRYFAGIGYWIQDNVQLRAGLSGRYRPYGQARIRGDWDIFDNQRLSLSETIFLGVDDGLGATTELTHLRYLGVQSVLRSRGSATVSTEIDGVSWNAALGWLWGQPERREWALDLLIQGNTQARVPTGEYGIRSIVRLPVYEDWLIAEFVVGRMYVRPNEDQARNGQWLAGVGLEMFF